MALDTIAGATRLVLCVLVVVACGSLLIGCGDSASAPKRKAGCQRPTASTVCRVLFIGNSYTYVNDLPAMFAKLASAGGQMVETGMLAKANATLADHAAAIETRSALSAGRWNVVVLQERSVTPSVERFRRRQMYPATRHLVRMIRIAGAQPLLYLTPAHRDGWPEYGLVGYARMQSAIDAGYILIARALHTPIAPVGYAWAAVLHEKPQPDLWQSDGSHPTVEGTYLTACVFYATAFERSPSGLRYHASLSDRDAAKLQAIASKVVLGDPAMWRLDR